MPPFGGNPVSGIAKGTAAAKWAIATLDAMTPIHLHKLALICSRMDITYVWQAHRSAWIVNCSWHVSISETIDGLFVCVCVCVCMCVCVSCSVVSDSAIPLCPAIFVPGHLFLLTFPWASRPLFPEGGELPSPTVLSAGLGAPGAAHQAPLSMEYSRQEDWSGVPFRALRVWFSK